MSHEPADVPSPIDLQDARDARAWADAANAVRPWRVTFFETIASAIEAGQVARVLELGSGPGFLAEHILQRAPGVQMVLLDFSAPMQELARERLRFHLHRVNFITRSFKNTDWMVGLGQFDHVVTHQAVHEMRHKRHAQPLHRQVRGILREGGTYLVSDHYFGADATQKRDLYMTVEEQCEALTTAGFAHVIQLLKLNGMVLHEAR